MKQACAFRLVPVFFALALSACIGLGKDGDEVMALTSAGDSAAFARVRAIVQVSCSSCHSFASYSEADWINQGYVKPGSPGSSLVIEYLTGQQGQPIMPPAGSLPNDQIAAFQTWISGIGTGPSSTSPSTPTGQGPARTVAALQVIHVNCASCHGAAQTASSAAFSGATVPAFATFTSDADFVTSGLVLPGQPKSSWLYRALRGAGDIGVMPATGATLSQSDQQALSDWITLMGQ